MKPYTISLLNSVVMACFVGSWVVLAIVGYFLLHVRRDAAFKRKWFPRFVMLVGALFILFSATLSALSPRGLGGLMVLFGVAPAVGLISWLNIKQTRFCDECGSTIFSHNWFSQMKYCSKCGAALDAKPETHGDPLD